ncbi:ComF family protein [Asaia lannensis]|uniref:ComF family protein n=1 Tax=Asaia lannensis NBRC 102526 TaxID=1307926 RepID=A0ABT1CFB5_9PROT|nr:ComF family protein [Asaia lannensis]MCO6159542.1 ComF family protein [Asaia lannensis NBRC 102526]
MKRLVLKHLNAFVRPVLDWVFPPVCLCCGAETTAPGLLCVQCFRQLAPIVLACTHCALPLPSADYADDEGRCPSCAKPRFPWYRAHAAFLYEGTARRLVLQLKYADRLDIVPFLGRAMLDTFGEGDRGGEVFVPVPLHRRRFWKRRFNQSALLAHALARKTAGARALPDALMRRRFTRILARLSPEDRKKALNGAIGVRPSIRADIIGRHVVLVDDILTTGATASICATQLLNAGARRVDLLVAARTVKLAGDQGRQGEEQE